MFPSHRPSVRRIDTPLSLHAALPLARHCCPSASPTETPSVRLYPVQSLCHALCLPASRPPARACLSSETEPTVRPRPSVRPFVSSLSIRPSLRPGKALKAACCSAGRGPAPMGAQGGRKGRTDFTLLLCRRLNIWIGGEQLPRHTAARRRRPRPRPAGGRGRRKKRKKTMS